MMTGRKAAAGLVAAILIFGGLWAVRSRMRVSGARGACEQFMTLLTTNRCHEAFALTDRATYDVSTEESFCRANAYPSASVSCDDGGQWQDETYLIVGTVDRSRSNGQAPTQSFGVKLGRVNGAWRVKGLVYDE